jgi:hypothetical protein
VSLFQNGEKTMRKPVTSKKKRLSFNDLLARSNLDIKFMERFVAIFGDIDLVAMHLIVAREIGRREHKMVSAVLAKPEK